MGTRSMTSVKDEYGDKIIEMYKQYDGYPEGMGEQLKQFIKSGTLVNGIPVGENKKFFNGMECFAAQLVSHFKQSSGGVYLHPPIADGVPLSDYSKMYGVEYYYEITLVDNCIGLTCWDTYENTKCFTWVNTECNK
jgi:hypothetical protein